MGKGSKRRPSAVSTKEFDDNWDKAFKPKKSKKETKKNGKGDSKNMGTN